MSYEYWSSKDFEENKRPGNFEQNLDFQKIDILIMQGNFSLNITILFNVIFLFLGGIVPMRRFDIWLKVTSKEALK